MLFKVDENLPMEAAATLRRAGHDAVTVRDQSLGGKPDQTIADICANERRAILSLDLDFADIQNYPPEKYAGIIVFRLHTQSRENVLAVIERVLTVLTVESLAGKLWIVDEQAIRIRGERAS
jgi:predicted nuclease of predicted toxin-antitoxin system